uniref:PE-PGRS family protein n=1 Tax=Parastrongyloides trichosuri TaxID=131310 RepID=A0A0N4ZL17_PARTI
MRFGLFCLLARPGEPPLRQDPSGGKAQGPSNEIPGLLMSSPHQQVTSPNGSGIAGDQLALVQLARGVAREVRLEGHRLGRLDRPQTRPHEAADSGLHLVGRLSLIHQFDDSHGHLAELVVRHADDGGVLDGFMLQQDGLDLLRIQVHPAGNDGEVATVGQVQIAVGVDVADVAKGLPPLGAGDLARLLGVAQILERLGGFEIDVADLADRQLDAVLPQNMDGAVVGPPDRAGMGQPFGRADIGRADAFTARIILVEDRPPPLDHLALDLDRAGRGGVDGDAVAGQVIGGANRLRQLQHAMEHGRHPQAVSHAKALNGLKAGFRVEGLGHDQHGPGVQGGVGEAVRRRVIERTGRQHDRAVAEPIGGGGPDVDRIGRVESAFRQGLQNTLGPSGRARTVEQVPPARGVGGQGRGLGRRQLRPVRERGADDVEDADLGAQLAQGLRRLGGETTLGDDDDLGLGIPDHIGQVIDRQLGGQEDVVEADPLGPQHGRQELRPVGDRNPDTVAALQTQGAQGVGRLIGLGFQRPEGDGPTAGNEGRRDPVRREGRRLHPGQGGAILTFQAVDDVGDALLLVDRAAAVAATADVLPDLDLAVVHLAVFGGLGAEFRQVVDVQTGGGQGGFQIVAGDAGEDVGIDDVFGAAGDDLALEAGAQIGEVGAHGLGRQHVLTGAHRPRQDDDAVEELTHLVDQGEGAAVAALAASAGADQDQAVDSHRGRLAGVAHIGDVVEDQTAVAVDFADDLGRRGAQAADDQRHLLAHDGRQVGLPARVQFAHDLVDAEGGDLGFGVFSGGRGQALADFGDPVDQGFLRTGVQRREGADDAAAALLDHHSAGWHAGAGRGQGNRPARHGQAGPEGEAAERRQRRLGQHPFQGPDQSGPGLRQPWSGVPGTLGLAAAEADRRRRSGRPAQRRQVDLPGGGLGGQAQGGGLSLHHPDAQPRRRGPEPPDPPDRRHAGRRGRGLPHHSRRAGRLWRRPGRQGRTAGAEQDRRPVAGRARGKGRGAEGRVGQDPLPGVGRVRRRRDRTSARRLGRGPPDPRRGRRRERRRRPRDAGRLAAVRRQSLPPISWGGGAGAQHPPLARVGDPDLRRPRARGRRRLPDPRSRPGGAGRVSGADGVPLAAAPRRRRQGPAERRLDLPPPALGARRHAALWPDRGRHARRAERRRRPQRRLRLRPGTGGGRDARAADPDPQAHRPGTPQDPAGRPRGAEGRPEHQIRPRRHGPARRARRPDRRCDADLLRARRRAARPRHGRAGAPAPRPRAHSVQERGGHGQEPEELQARRAATGDLLRGRGRRHAGAGNARRPSRHGAERGAGRSRPSALAVLDLRSAHGRAGRAGAQAGRPPLQRRQPASDRRDSVRRDEPARRQEDRQRPMGHRRQRAGGAGPDPRPAAHDPGLAPAFQAEGHLYRRPGGGDGPADEPGPHFLSAGGGDDGASGLIRPQPAEHPDPHRDGTPDPSGLHRFAGPCADLRRLQPDRAAPAGPHRRHSGAEEGLQGGARHSRRHSVRDVRRTGGRHAV